MAGKKRAYGADIALLIGRYSDGGAAPVSFHRLLVSSTSLSGEQSLGYESLIGGGTNEAQDPFYEAVSDDGDLVLPIDVRATGFVLAGILGDPVTDMVKASGVITFSAQPAAGSVITINGTAWTFVAGAVAGAQTQIGADLAATIDALADDLNASADADIAACTYTAGATELTIEADTAGIAGNAVTLAAAAATNAVVSAATLLGGGYRHTFTSGAADVAEYLVEIGHVKLATPKFYRNEQVKFGGLKISLAQTGRAKMTVSAIGVAETKHAATLDAAPESWGFIGFSNSGSYVERGGVRLGGVTAGSLDYSNGLEAVRSIRSDQKIDGADLGEHTAKGSVTLRFGTADADVLDDAAVNQQPLTIGTGFVHPAGWSLNFALSRVYFPRPKKEVKGPGAIEQQFDFQASGAGGAMLTVTLINDVANYD